MKCIANTQIIKLWIVPRYYLVVHVTAKSIALGCEPPVSYHQTLFGARVGLQPPASEQHSLEELLLIAPLASYFPMDK